MPRWFPSEDDPFMFMLALETVALLIVNVVCWALVLAGVIHL